jgi:hypothetical protein
MLNFPLSFSCSYNLSTVNFSLQSIKYTVWSRFKVPLNFSGGWSCIEVKILVGVGGT